MALRREIQLWVDALRSGEFDQCQDVLHKQEDGYCCLGVACEVAIQDGLPLERRPSEWDHALVVEYGVRGQFDPQLLPLQVQEWAGLDGGSGVDLPGITTYHGFHISLIDLNDSGLTFDQIADVIEWYFDE